MKIRKISLNNFKRFKKAEFDLGKITLLTGANSSGKSSVIYGVLGALQTNEFPFFFSPNGDYINMGDYEEMAFGHEANREISIELDLSEGGKSEVFHLNATYFNNSGIPKLLSLSWKRAQFSFVVNFNKKTKAYKAEFKFADDHFLKSKNHFKSMVMSLVEQSTKRLSENCLGGDPREHPLGHGEIDQCFGVLDSYLVVADQAA